MNCLRFFLLLLLVPGLIGGSAALAQGVVVYKHVDPSGRTTYSNQPIKGAVVVELSPLTVLPKLQTAVIATSTQARPVEAQPNSNALSEVVSPQAPPPIPTASEVTSEPTENSRSTSGPLPIGSQTQSASATLRGLSGDARRPLGVATNGGTNTVMAAQQRREDIRRRIIEAEIGAEAQLLAETQGYLQREQSKSVAMRSLRAAIVVDNRAAAGKQPLSDDIVATKMVVERHFERVRELQDQVLVHEENLAELRAQLRAPPQRVALKTVADMRPTAALTTARLGGTRGH